MKEFDSFSFRRAFCLRQFDELAPLTIAEDTKKAGSGKNEKKLDFFS